MIRHGISLFVVMFFAACAQVAPPYQTSIQNVQTLRDSGIRQVKVGQFTAGNEANNESISLRGSPMSSPVNGKYTDYLAEAMRAEFRAAMLYQDGAALQIGGVMLKNDVDVSGLSEASAEMEVQVVVRQGEQVRYDRVKYARLKFESSFAGAVAVPAGVRAYPGLVQQFLADLFSDKDFISALK
jgi:hypothetical protein